MSERRIICTGDGSASLYDERVGESYHSSHGAVTESMHVFIEAGLKAVLPMDRVRILEIGLGTGLNAILAYQCAITKGFSVDYTAVEGYPMDLRFLPDLDFGLNSTQRAKWEQIMLTPWAEWHDIGDGFRILKNECLFDEMVFDTEEFDLVFFDAFSPSHQPEVWSDKILGKVVDAMDLGSLLTTYCCRGHVKRSLRALGLEIEKLPGPPGKREMLRAWKR